MPEPSSAKRDERTWSRGTDGEKHQQTVQNIPGPPVKQEGTFSTLPSARNAKTFLKRPSGRKENLQPLPWPMPPKISAQDSESESLGSASKSKEKDFLTPQSSFARDEDKDSSSDIRRLQSVESYRDGSETASRESSVRKESFSSLGTGFSVGVADSSDDGSAESVSKVDIDADEFSCFLREGAEHSGAGVDFANLFAEEDQEAKRGDSKVSTRTEPHSSSLVSENSTTPKATRTPFLNHTGSGSESNNVSLKEALKFSPDNKTVGPENGRPYDIKKNVSERPSEQDSRREQMSSLDTLREQNKEAVLRRPMASKRATFLVPPPKTGKTSIQNKSSASSSKGELNSNETPVQAEETAPGNGVIMRAHHHVSHVAGIRRAETGRIMSREEMKARKPIMFQESPNPKSLNPAGFMSAEEDVSTVHPSTFLPESSSDSETVADEQRNQTTKMQPSATISPKSKSSGTRKSSKVDDGSFLSPGILSRKKKFGPEEYRVGSFQFSEHEGSSGLLNFFSSGLRKVHFGAGKKSSLRDVKSQEGDSTIIVPGTIDETVCKICVVCRKNLEYDVYVKDTGKKIKVESKKDGRTGHLRATVLVRQAPGESACYVNIRQSRSDGMKTSLATLWRFYQRLEAGLKEMD